MATITSEPRLVLEKAVLVHAPDFDDVGCVCRVRIAYDANLNQGSISIRFSTALAGFDEPQLLMLNIQPDTVDSCTLASRSKDILIPPRMFSMVPLSVMTASAVLTLKLCLDASGTILVPPQTTALRPSNEADADFHAFTKICQAKTIHLHFSKQQFKSDELPRIRTQLRSLSGALSSRTLDAEPFDPTRLNAGRGVQERDCSVFDQPLHPPPYSPSLRIVRGNSGAYPHGPSQTILSRTGYQQSVLGKRSRDNASTSPSRVTRTPPWSPTEINTPSTCSQLNPTELERVQHYLAQAPDHLIRQLLIESGHEQLLAPLDLPQPENGEKVANIDALIQHRVDEYLSQHLDALTKAAFKQHTKRHIVKLVENQLPTAAELYLNGATESHRDAFYQDCKINEEALHETIDEGRTTVRAATDECAAEIKELADGYITAMTEQAKKLEVAQEEELARLRCWFSDLAEKFFGTEMRRFDRVAVDHRRNSV